MEPFARVNSSRIDERRSLGSRLYEKIVQQLMSYPEREQIPTHAPGGRVHAGARRTSPVLLERVR